MNKPHACTISGHAGLYVKSGDTWIHWRWAILGICADSVAEQQTIGEANKMHSIKPCIDTDCERRVFNPIEYGYSSTDERRVISSNMEFHAMGLHLIHMIDEESECYYERESERVNNHIKSASNDYEMSNTTMTANLRCLGRK